MTGDNCFKINLADALTRLPGPQNENAVTVLEHGSLVTRLYAPRGNDPQTPHSKDEVYVVARGSGEFVCGARRQSFEARDVLFVAAGVEHHFENFTEDFAVWVFFYGPEGGETDQA